VRTVLRPMALSGSGYPGPGGGLAMRRLVVGDAQLTTQGFTVSIGACHFRSPSRNL
jgi:hypothetical protein